MMMRCGRRIVIATTNVSEAPVYINDACACASKIGEETLCKVEGVWIVLRTSDTLSYKRKLHARGCKTYETNQMPSVEGTQIISKSAPNP